VHTSSSSVGILKIVVWDILVFASALTNNIKSGGVPCSRGLAAFSASVHRLLDYIARDMFSKSLEKTPLRVANLDDYLLD
jgi:hypothetical protein